MEKEDIKEKIITLISVNDQISKEELFAHFEMDKSLISNVLDELIQECRVVLDGNKLVLGKKIFISYARRDTVDLAQELFDWLKIRKYSPFFDKDPKDGIPVSEPHWDAKIEMKIVDSKLIIFLLSPCSVREKSFCRNEIFYAQRKDVPIIPVFVSDVVPPITIIMTQGIEAYKNPKELFEQLEFYIDYVLKNGEMPYREMGNVWWEAFETIHFDEEIKQYGDSFIGREWLFKAIDDWVTTSKDKVLLLTADPGFGKSALVTHFYYKYNVKGLHLCRSSLPASCHPNSWLKLLIKQLAIQFEPYAESIKNKKPNWNTPPESLFRTLISDPLLICQNQIHTEDRWIFLIDGLDESFSVFGPEFVDLIAVSAKRIPDWIRLIITSRPDDTILEKLNIPGLCHVPLLSENTENCQDLQQFIEKRVDVLSKVQIIDNKLALIKRIFDISAGNFLFASLTLDAISEKNEKWRISLHNLDKLPIKIEGLYVLMFEKRFPKDYKYEENIGPIIDCLIAAQGTIPKNILIKSSGLEYQKALYALNALSQFLITSQDQNTSSKEKKAATGDNRKIRLFHKSFSDWLSKKRDIKRGHGYLAHAGYRDYIEDKEHLSEYWYAHLPTHLLECKMYKEVVCLFQDPVFFNYSWKLNEFDLKSIWVKIEKCSSYRLLDVYQPVLQNPDQYPKQFTLHIAKLITDFGYSNEAVQLKRYLVEKYRKEQDIFNLIPILSELAYDLYTNGKIDEAWALMLEHESLCERAQDKKNLQICYGRQGNLLHDQGRYDMAMEKYKKQEQICLETDDLYWLQKSYGNQGIIHLLRGDLDTAANLFKKQEEICQKIRHMVGLQTSIGNQGLIEYTVGNFDSALTLFQEQQKICEEIGYLRGLYKSLGNQGNIFLIKKEFKQASTLFEKEEQICSKINDVEGLQTAIGHLANLKSEMGFLDDALELYKKQEEICKKIHNCEWYQICLGRQAVIFREKGDVNTALALFTRQEEYCRKYGFSESLQKCLGNIGITYAMIQQSEKALDFFHKQKEICEDKKYPIGLQQAIGHIALIHHIQGHKNMARKFYREQEKICRDILYEPGLKTCLKNQKKLDAE